MTEAFLRLLRNSVEEIANALREDSHENGELSIRRLEVLAEQAMSCDGVTLDVVDMLNEAKNLLKQQRNNDKEYSSYQAPQEVSGLRGRPRFAISEEQICFFQGAHVIKNVLQH